MNARFLSRSFKAGLVVAAVTLALSGCTSNKWGFPYKASVQQGNWITQEQVALLQPGMTREQVRFALGSPTLTSVLHADRWDYPYYFKPGYGAAQERKFTVWFDHDRLTRWEGDAQPELQPFQVEQGPIADEKATQQLNTEAERLKSEQNASPAIIDSPVNPLTSYPGQPGVAPQPLE